MTDVAWEQQALGRHHDRASFDCGEVDLNTYLQRYARQNHASGASKCFVAVPTAETARILGYYTLSPASLDYSRTPAVLRKGLARYDVPVFRLGRLAVDRSVHGRGLGAALLQRAGERCLQVSLEVGGVALLIDAKDEAAARWYLRFGALPLLDTPQSLVLTFATLLKASTSQI
jgi:GNAT superfamily N-acetyltransferase